MATSSAALRIGGSHFESCGLHPSLLGNPRGHRSLCFSYPPKFNQSKPRQCFAVRAEYSGGSRHGAGDFIAGFLLGGAVFGTLAYVFAPQIRKSILNENEHGFQRAKRPIYYDEGYDEGLVTTRQTLNEKISQLNSAIDNVSSRLRGAITATAPEPSEADTEVEAAM